MKPLSLAPLLLAAPLVAGDLPRSGVVTIQAHGQKATLGANTPPTSKTHSKSIVLIRKQELRSASIDYPTAGGAGGGGSMQGIPEEYYLGGSSKKKAKGSSDPPDEAPQARLEEAVHNFTAAQGRLVGPDDFEALRGALSAIGLEPLADDLENAQPTPVVDGFEVIWEEVLDRLIDRALADPRLDRARYFARIRDLLHERAATTRDDPRSQGTLLELLDALAAAELMGSPGTLRAFRMRLVESRLQRIVTLRRGQVAETGRVSPRLRGRMLDQLVLRAKLMSEAR